MLRIVAVIAGIITLALFSLTAALIAPARSTTTTPTPTPYPIKDQDTCTTSPLGAVPVAGSTWKAQTFVPSVSGRLVRVEIPGLNTGGTSILHIRNTTNGSPSGTDIVSATISCGNSFDFGNGVSLTAGQLYALVLSNSGGIDRYEWSYSDSSTCYPNPLGYPFTSTDSGSTWGGDIVDF